MLQNYLVIKLGIPCLYLHYILLIFQTFLVRKWCAVISFVAYCLWSFFVLFSCYRCIRTLYIIKIKKCAVYKSRSM